MESVLIFFFFNDTATTEIYTLSLHDALPITRRAARAVRSRAARRAAPERSRLGGAAGMRPRARRPARVPFARPPGPGARGRGRRGPARGRERDRGARWRKPGARRTRAGPDA